MSHLPGTPLADWLNFRAANAPGREALVADGRSWTYAELDVAATRMARLLAAWDVKRGDRVAMLLSNGAGAATLVHAALRLGATLVPLNVRLSASELSWQIQDSGARLLVVDTRTAASAERARRDVPGLVTVTLESDIVDSAACAALDARDEVDVDLLSVHDADDVFAIVYTSGTTGQPKGAMLTVGNFWWSAVGSALNLGTHTDDRWLACMPLFHVGGLSILLRSAIYGITAIVQDGFDADAVNRAIDEDGVTIISVVLVMLQRMLDAHGDRPFPSSLRCVLLGGGPAPQPLLERCARLGIPVAQSYGLTETTSQLATLAPVDALRKLGTAGRPIYPNEIRISINHRNAAPDEAGEILVRGPVVMAGYVGRPEATAIAVVGGWLHTGDFGSLDADGYLRVLDRRNDLIITGGENVYPAEVEAAILTHERVAEVAVVGVPDEQWGQKVIAVIRLRSTDGARPTDVEAELRSHCRSRLAGYKTPREFRIVTEELPRTASGKLRRSVLRERFSPTEVPTD
ncbi:MAG: o-succinylbenzoate--CoA ligase [Gemmatimonadaceae bacterium]